VLRSPHPRVTWALDEGLQHGEGPSRRLPSHIAAPDTISVRASLQPGEAYGTRITVASRVRLEIAASIDRDLSLSSTSVPLFLPRKLEKGQE
jgi:hypothetical protein